MCHLYVPAFLVSGNMPCEFPRQAFLRRAQALGHLEPLIFFTFFFSRGLKRNFFLHTSIFSHFWDSLFVVYWVFSGKCIILFRMPSFRYLCCRITEVCSFSYVGSPTSVPNRRLVCSSPSNPAQPAAVRPRMTWENRTRDSGDERHVFRHLHFQFPVMGSALMALAVNTFKQEWLVQIVYIKFTSPN